MKVLNAEVLKQRHSPMVWISFIAFALAPLMGGLFMIIAQHPEAMAQSGMLKQKAEMMSFEANWKSYAGLLSQAMGVGGILLYGFVASWIFGREFTDKTATDLLSLPVTRTQIINAKFVTYLAWCVALAVSNLLIMLILGSIIQLDGWSDVNWMQQLETYSLTTLMTVAVCMPVAFFAMIGGGYLAPLGFTALILVLAQVVAAAGVGFYFPWSIPGLYSGAGGEYKDQLDTISYLLVGMVAMAGYFMPVYWWNNADQK